MGGVGRKARTGIDLPRNGRNLVGQVLKNEKNPQKILGGHALPNEAFEGIRSDYRHQNKNKR